MQMNMNLRFSPFILQQSLRWTGTLFAKSLPLMTMALLTSGSLSLFSSAWATDLPTGVLNYLRQKDPGVQVRFDGLVRFSNGERYVPVIPQDPGPNADPKQVIAITPEKSPFPDLIEFDNHFFLIRLIQTVSGRLTFAKLDNYPIQLKEGLLPQDFVLPENLFIPVELKVILGALPYNPAYTPSKPATATTTTKPASGKTPAKGSIATAANPSKTPAAPATLSLEDNNLIDHRGRVAYVFDIPEQKLFSIDPASGRKQSDVGLDCAPAALQVSPDGKLLFAPCLSSNELVVMDTEANLVKNRLKVGERPDALLYLPTNKQVWISNRFSPYLSVINVVNLLPSERIELPGNGGALALFPTNTQNTGKGKNPEEVAVADATQPTIYILNQETRQVARTVNGLPDISAITVLDHGDNHREVWVASRTESRVMALDALTGAVLGKFDVGRKPVAITAYANKLYILCAGDAQINVIDTVRKLALEPIALEENSFPSGLMAFPASARAYISAAGADRLVVLNLKEARIETTIPVDFRASLIAFTPDPEPAISPASPALKPVPQMPQATVMPSPAAETTTPRLPIPFLTTGTTPGANSSSLPEKSASPITPIAPAPPLIKSTLPAAKPLPLSTPAQQVYKAPPKTPVAMPVTIEKPTATTIPSPASRKLPTTTPSAEKSAPTNTPKEEKPVKSGPTTVKNSNEKTTKTVTEKPVPIKSAAAKSPSKPKQTASSKENNTSASTKSKPLAAKPVSTQPAHKVPVSNNTHANNPKKKTSTKTKTPEKKPVNAQLHQPKEP